MKKSLRFDLYSGFTDDPKYTEKDRWCQAEGETLEDLAQAIYDQVVENGEMLLNDEGDEDDQEAV